MSTTTRDPAGTPPKPAQGSRQLLMLLCGAQFMILLDASIVNVALPAISRDLGFGHGNLQWIVNAYTLAFAGFLLLGGRLADILGRKFLFQSGIILFTIASLAGGVAQDEGTLLAARALQGLGAALLAPSILTILTTTYSEGQARAKAMGAWTASSGVGFAAGALFGGVLVEVANWRWTLLINIPFGIAGLAVAQKAIPATPRPPRRARLDVLGVLLSTAGLLSLTYGAVSSGERGWSSPVTWGTLLAGVVLLGWFVVHETAVAREPIMPLRLLTVRSVAAANLTMFWISAAVYPSLFVLSLYVQNVLGYSALKAGLAFLAPTIAMAATSQFAARLNMRVGPRTLLLIAAALGSTGLAWLTQVSAGGSFLSDVLAPSVLTFLGLGLANAPLAMAAMSGVAPNEAGLASGILNTTRQVGISLGLAVIATVAADTTRNSHASDPLHNLTAGYGAAFGVAAGLAVLALLCAFFLPGATRAAPRPAPAPATEPTP
ncbi:MFS transporter [Actinomadura macrotermitis]|uniref:Putative MFS-type transporter EfpA n=1 Tax=Actinomadura macrotermitis TaxID=2585200 RepID=A0A7K0BVY6_9ACTN|nr:MFS transporter [Actinomadura macrotermitis]MQY05062.1 putative MFS-type transporter EfpA [Actinomadura macrotermitis]